MTPPLSLEDARRRLLAPLAPLGSETVPTMEAGGRFLAEDLHAARTQPAADLSAMDGFACAGPGPWRIAGESRAGHPLGHVLAPGEAAAISTGALLPQGADRILIVEEAEIEAGQLMARGDPPRPGRFIRRTGLDFRAGDVLLDAGTRLDAPQIALALAAGHPALAVGRRPRLALIDCGDELSAETPPVAAHLLPASNAFMLREMARPVCSEIVCLGPIADELATLAAAIDRCDTDVVVTTGGASIGEHDLVRPALERLGFSLAFWRVSIKPGKPLLVARKGARTVIGLPGNPVSAFVTGWLFVLPALRRLAGAARLVPDPIALPLAGDCPSGGARREFLRAHLAGGQVVIHDQQDSSALLSLARATVLVDRPANAAKAKRGTPVPCYSVQNGGIA